MAFRNWGFCDLSIKRNYDLNKLHEIEGLGFRTIALNSHVEEGNDEPKKKKKKGEVKDKQDFVPAPIDVPKHITEKSKLNILQRLTIEFSDSSISHKINQSENIKKYDLVAVIPKTLAAFQYACGTMEIDIISFDPQSRIPFKISRKLYRQAIDRGIFFEIMYWPAILDSTSRKNIISNAHNYFTLGKSKNVVVTSNGENHMQMRGVYDVINLGFILGLNDQQSLHSIRDNASQLILKGQSRKSGKLYVLIKNEESNNK